MIPVWKEIAALKPGALEASNIPQKREEGWVCLTATGLNLIGRIGHKLTSDKDMKGQWKHYADRLGKIDWKRGAEIWQGNIIQGNRMLIHQVPLRNAFEKVCQEIGLSQVVQAAPQGLNRLDSEQAAESLGPTDSAGSEPGEKSQT